MKILIGDAYSTLVTKDLRIRQLVDTTIRARPKGFQFTKAYKKGVWDGYTTLREGNKIPTGLLGLVVGALRKAGYTVDLDWSGVRRRRGIAIDDECLKGIILRDYQLDAANILIEAGRGIASMATNSGKTEVMAAILSTLNAGLVVVQRKELLYQTATRIEKRLGIDVGLIGDGVKTYRPITVAMIQTLANMRVTELRGMFKDNEAIFIDECHHGSASQYLNTLHNIPGFHRFGFSGTPLKYQALDDLRLVGLTGKVLFIHTNSQLIEAGYSAEPEVYIHKLEPVYSDGGASWQDVYDSGIVNNEERNNKIVELASGNGVTLIIVSRVEHGLHLQRLIPDSVFVYGGDDTSYRQGVLESMAAGNGIYIATNIFDEGIDVPAISNLIMAAGGKSERSLLQRIGRGLRVKEDGGGLTVHDFQDEGKYLSKHSQARIDAYLAEEFNITYQ